MQVSTKFIHRNEEPAWLQTRIARRIFFGLAIFTAIVCFFFFVHRGGDLAHYIRVGNLLLDSKDIYRDLPPGINTWPPFFSIVSVIFALLAKPSVYLARTVWLLFNYALIIVLIRWIIQLAYKRRLVFDSTRQSDGVPLLSFPVLLPLALAAGYLLANLQFLQINIALYAMIIAGLMFHQRGQNALAGLLIGFTLAVKVMPALILPYFLYRRQWRAALYTTAAAAIFFFSPILLFGWAQFWDYVAAWNEAVNRGWGIGFMNQSIPAMWDRYFPPQYDHLVYPAVALSAAITGTAALATFRGAYDPERKEILHEWSVVLIASLLFSPVMWKAYLVMMLLSYVLLFSILHDRGAPKYLQTTTTILLLGSFVLGTLASPGLLGRAAAEFLKENSSVTWSALLILANHFLYLFSRLPKRGEGDQLVRRR